MNNSIITGYHLFNRQRMSDKADTKLDYVWLWLEPLALAMVFWLLYQYRAINVVNEYPYSLFIISGILTWQALVDCINTPMTEIGKFKEIVSQIEISVGSIASYFLIKALYYAFFKIAIIAVFVGVFFGTDILALILFFSFAIIIFILFSCIGMLFSPYSFLLKDVQKFINMLLRPLMFISGVLFPILEGTLIYKLNEYNPFYITIDNLRIILIEGLKIEAIFSLSLLVSILLFPAVYGVVTFKRGFKIAIESQ